MQDDKFKHYVCFSPLIIKFDIVTYLIKLDTEFENIYYLYQDLLISIGTRNPETSYESVDSANEEISEYM